MESLTIWSDDLSFFLPESLSIYNISTTYTIGKEQQKVEGAWKNENGGKVESSLATLPSPSLFFLAFFPPPPIIWMPGRGYNNLHLSPLADIDKKKRTKHTSPSYGVNWEFSLFEDDVHNHVKKCELKEKKSVRKKPISSCVKITCYLTHEKIAIARLHNKWKLSQSSKKS